MAFNQGPKSLKDQLLREMEINGDVTFLVGIEDDEKEEIKASTFILRATSSVFNVMFNDVWNSQDNPDPIELSDVRPNIFRIFLAALVTEDYKSTHLSDWKLADFELFQLLDMGRKYDVSSVVWACKICLQILMSSHHPQACNIFETARLYYNEPNVAASSLHVIENHALEVFQSAEFLGLSKELLSELLKNDKLIIDELSLFQAVVSWATAKCNEDNLPVNGGNIRKKLGGLLYLIRFPLITPDKFTLHVAPTKILNDKEMLDIFLYTSTPNDQKRFSMARNITFSPKPRAWVTTNPETAKVEPRQSTSSHASAPRDFSNRTLGYRGFDSSTASSSRAKKPRIQDIINAVLPSSPVEDNNDNNLYRFDDTEFMEEPEVDDDGFN